jgi:hypothetical protein
MWICDYTLHIHTHAKIKANECSKRPRITPHELFGKHVDTAHLRHFCLSFVGLGAAEICGPQNPFLGLARQRCPGPETRLPAVQPRFCYRGGAGFQHPVFRPMGELFGKRVRIQPLEISVRPERTIAVKWVLAVQLRWRTLHKTIGYCLNDRA